MKILDTQSAQQKELVLKGKIKIYLCGVTVYDDSHIGHARTIIVFDVLRRYLEKKGHEVEMVQNFTDIDDKIIKKAQQQKETASQLSQRYIKNYYRDFDALNIKRATQYPKATEHITDMIALIESLVDKKAAYVSKNGVYFAVSQFPEYGKLSKKDITELQSGARIKIDADKADPLDFALWKFADTGPVWPSPWGDGRPGWHIECSAMSLKYLGSGFDIHGGGRDLIFPHHENEIAQSEAHTGKMFAKTWMHVGMVTIDGQKMSKSLGNIKTVSHVLENWGSNVIRLFCLSGHYSKPIDYSEDLLKENLVKWRQVEAAYYELVHAQNPGDIKQMQEIIRESKNDFDAALENDFNTHLALAAFFRLIKEINKMAAGEQLNKSIAGIAKTQVEQFLETLGLHIPEITAEQIKSINDMIAKRKDLRISKQYKEADKLRDTIAELNVEILDHKSSSVWIKKEKIKADTNQ